VVYEFYDVFRLFSDLTKIVLMIVLIIMMLKTRKRTMERPRIGETIDLEKIGGDKETALINVAEISGEDDYDQFGDKDDGEDHFYIDVNIKSRTNSHFDDKFKITVNYKYIKHDFSKYYKQADKNFLFFDPKKEDSK